MHLELSYGPPQVLSSHEEPICSHRVEWTFIYFPELSRTVTGQPVPQEPSQGPCIYWEGRELFPFLTSLSQRTNNGPVWPSLLLCLRSVPGAWTQPSSLIMFCDIPSWFCGSVSRGY